MSVSNISYSEAQFRGIAPHLRREHIQSAEHTLFVIESTMRRIASDPNFNINDPYFHTFTDRIDANHNPSRFYYLPGVLNLFCELGYHIDAESSIKQIKSRFIEWLNARGLDNNGCDEIDVTLAAFQVLGRWSRSKEMVEVIAQSKYPEAKRAFNEGKSEFFTQLSNTVTPVLDEAGVTTALIPIILDYAKDEIIKLQPENDSNVQENMP